MHCPFCGNQRTEVYNSRNTAAKRRIWRRRRCIDCKQAFTTYESGDLSFITVTKQNDSEEPYVRSKLLISIYQASMGLEGSIENVDSLTDTIEDKILSVKKQQITSSEIAEIAMKVLQRFNTSAYVRYLSYRGDLASAAQLKQALRNV